jgi:PilZ domain-containing protein
MTESKEAAATQGSIAEMDKRRAQRRKLPFGRTALLEVAGETHVVALVDLSITGAYLAMRSAVPRDSPLRLRIRIPRAGEMALPCELVRETGDDPAQGRRAGIGVRFLKLDEATTTRLAAFVAERGSPFGG